MDRRKFILNACTACVSATALSAAVSGCAASKYVSGNLSKDGILLDKKEFFTNNQNPGVARPWVIVRNDALLYPICVFRFSELEYSALWMRCSHQGAELQAFGDTLQCPAHGSEFNNKGAVVSGPADTELRNFPVSIQGEKLFIDLRKQS